MHIYVENATWICMEDELEVLNRPQFVKSLILEICLSNCSRYYGQEREDKFSLIHVLVPCMSSSCVKEEA